MTETPSSRSEELCHTLVCDEAECSRITGAFLEGYRALISQHIDASQVSRIKLAAAVGLSRRQLGRILKGLAPLKNELISMLVDVLAIDRARSILAIAVLGDWQRYNDANLGIIVQLIGRTLDRLDARAEFAIEPLTEPAADQIADWIAEVIVTNAEQIRQRRDMIVDLPELRRPVRRRYEGE